MPHDISRYVMTSRRLQSIETLIISMKHKQYFICNSFNHYRDVKQSPVINHSSSPFYRHSYYVALCAEYWHRIQRKQEKINPRVCWHLAERNETRRPTSFNPFSAGERLYTSESDVCRRQILTYKDCPRTERIKLFLMAVDPYHRYSNESQRDN